MPRRTHILGTTIPLMNIYEIFKESIRILLLHPTHFHSISIFLFSPLPISLFISHFLVHQFPKVPTSTLRITHRLIGENGLSFLPKTTNTLLSNSIFAFLICFPSSITFSLLGKAAIVQAVADSYNGIISRRENIHGRYMRRSGLVWFKLVHLYLCELLITLVLNWIFLLGLTIIPRVLYSNGICSRVWCFWGVLGIFGVLFCFGFAHAMIICNLARVVTVLESDCYGFKAMVKAKCLLKGRRETALVIALLSNVGLRLVESLFEFRLCRGIGMWEGPMLVSMYCLVLVVETIMNVVFYYTCKW